MGVKSKVVITGVAGFMGSWLADLLIKEGHQLIGVDDLSGGYPRNLNKDCIFIGGDVRNKALMNRVTKGAKIIYHLAAYAAEGQSAYSPIAINDINIKGINTVLVAAVNNNVDKVVFASSIAVYGNLKPPFIETMSPHPEDPYGIGKLYGEQMLKVFKEAHGLDYTILRPYNVYGERQNIADPYRNAIGIWINRIMKGKPPIIYGDGEQKRAFSYVEDTMRAFMNAGLEPKTNGQIINIGSDRPYTINSACDMVLGAMGSKLEAEHVPARKLDVKIAYSDCTKAKTLLGLENRTPFELGVKRMTRWALKLGPQRQTYKLPLEIKKGAPEIWLKKKM